MPNKRQLKKKIHALCGEAAMDVMFQLPPEIAQDAVFEIARLQNRTVANITFSFDHVTRDYSDKNEYRKARRVYTRKAFNALKQNFDSGLRKIVADINTKVKDSKKDE